MFPFCFGFLDGGHSFCIFALPRVRELYDLDFLWDVSFCAAASLPRQSFSATDAPATRKVRRVAALSDFRTMTSSYVACSDHPNPVQLYAYRLERNSKSAESSRHRVRESCGLSLFKAF